MRHVEISAFIPGANPTEVFDTLSDFARYPELVEIVRAVTVTPAVGDGPVLSTWEVLFRNGILRWTEEDWLHRDRLTIDFVQTEGDFEELTGGWVVTQQPDGVGVVFYNDFDFGIPSLATIIDPVAERVLTETIQLILGRLFEGATFPPARVATPAGHAEG
ncbi:type II toxin-antitoxin system RatA family toxin [Phytohabitans rumicis]|uniref:Cyclase n=1 Tax=Phytohabitans rumicis TaxID=1076125 RepID=A0A6V8LG37_9ACTN|nr:SRPBCC family protein [Phytohabitans rumicis]GFJ91605.1 cyclase [Phytohabitans rumicis]